MTEISKILKTQDALEDRLRVAGYSDSEIKDWMSRVGRLEMLLSPDFDGG